MEWSGTEWFKLEWHMEMEQNRTDTDKEQTQKQIADVRVPSTQAAADGGDRTNCMLRQRL